MNQPLPYENSVEIVTEDDIVQCYDSLHFDNLQESLEFLQVTLEVLDDICDFRLDNNQVIAARMVSGWPDDLGWRKDDVKLANLENGSVSFTKQALFLLKLAVIKRPNRSTYVYSPKYKGATKARSMQTFDGERAPALDALVAQKKSPQAETLGGTDFGGGVTLPDEIRAQVESIFAKSNVVTLPLEANKSSIQKIGDSVIASVMRHDYLQNHRSIETINTALMDARPEDRIELCYYLKNKLLDCRSKVKRYDCFDRRPAVEQDTFNFLDAMIVMLTRQTTEALSNGRFDSGDTTSSFEV